MQDDGSHHQSANPCVVVVTSRVVSSPPSRTCLWLTLLCRQLLWDELQTKPFRKLMEISDQCFLTNSRNLSHKLSRHFYRLPLQKSCPCESLEVSPKHFLATLRSSRSHSRSPGVLPVSGLPASCTCLCMVTVTFVFCTFRIVGICRWRYSTNTLSDNLAMSAVLLSRVIALTMRTLFNFASS